MLQPDVVARLRLLADTARVPAAADTTRVNEVAPLTPGQRVTARIERELPNARFHVIAQGKTYEMKLPAGLRPGQTLELRYVSDAPRPTFLLANTAPGNHGNDLSQLGRIIAALLGPKQQSADGARLPRTVPPLTGNPADTAKTPALLRAVLAESGIFYESHQAQWVAGRLPIEQLRREPQGKLPPIENLKPETNPTPKEAAAATRPATAVSTNTAERVPVADLRTGPASGQSVGSNTPQQSPIHPETAPVVRQQLDTLDTRHVIWEGEAWPGQWMQWETGEEPPAAGEQLQAAWYSTLTLELPALGVVRIRTVLAGTGARVSVECVDSGTGEKLRAARALLATNLESRGIGLMDFGVMAHAMNTDNPSGNDRAPSNTSPANDE